MNENVIVTDKKKIEEIRKALKSPDKGFANIKPAAPDKLPENAKKYGLVLTSLNQYAIIPLSPHERLTSFLHSYKESKAPDEMPRVLSFS